MDIRQEDAGYYCLLIAILCDLDVNEAQKMYQYGPDHPICRKLRKKKVSKGELEQMDTVSKNMAMKHLREKGYSIDAISDVFDCHPSTVKRRLKKLEDGRK